MPGGLGGGVVLGTAGAAAFAGRLTHVEPSLSSPLMCEDPTKPTREMNWRLGAAAGHIEYLSQKQFMDPDEWLGEEGRRFRCWPGVQEPADEFKQAWAAFKQRNSGRSQSEIIAMIDAIHKECECPA